MNDKAAPLHIGVTTYGYLYTATLEGSLESIARAGYRSVEITPLSPHLPIPAFDWFQRKRLKRRLDDLGLTCVCINPSELNILSPNAEIRDLSIRQIEFGIVLAHDLGAQFTMVLPGRSGVLISMPAKESRELALQQLRRLVKTGREYGVTLALETIPSFGLIKPAAELASLVREVDDPHLGVCVDAANLYGYEDVPKAVADAGKSIVLAHLSDSWGPKRFAHTSIGRGEVDFPQYMTALRAANFYGPCIYELCDGEDPDPRIADDLARLKAFGWSA